MTTTITQTASGAKTERTKVYFPGLNALRFFAASLVMVSHAEQMKDFWGLPNIHHQSSIANLAALAVTFFFTLSGFLITFLLFVEKDKQGDISVKNFYLRRILRIWPLYYVIVILAFFILPHIPGLSLTLNNSTETTHYRGLILLLYALMLPNVVQVFNLAIAYATQLWSIGVEEQFYIIWPWLIKKTNHYLLLLSAIIGFFFVARNGFAFAASHAKSGNEVFSLLNSFLISFGCMAVGGIVAWLLYTKSPWFQRYFINRIAEVISFTAFLTLAVMDIYIPYAYHEIYAAIFAVFIANISQNDKSIFRLENRLWTELGNISYGIYMYHLLGIGLTLLILKKTNFDFHFWLTNVILHILSLIFTVIISYLSYMYFESYFLKIKHKFTRVKSGSF